ncbi:MAG TPA: nuclease-related domain-containing protein [Candidatus Limnocylindria bacterium]|nr:nuclease-related domain-containing protein [Candidatus Limnocylindria bacterium]
MLELARGLAFQPRGWRTPLRAGLALVGGGSLAAGFVVQLALAPLTAILPLGSLAAGVLLLVRALPRLARDGRLRRIALDLQRDAGDEFAVIAEYVPRDGAELDIDLVVVGPTGVFAIEVCESSGEVACYDDVWYRRQGSTAWRFPFSPTRAARWKASRLKADVAESGFVRTTVESLVYFPYAQISEIVGSTAVAVEGLDMLVKHLRGWNRSPLSDRRARAIARSLSGTLGIAS